MVKLLKYTHPAAIGYSVSQPYTLDQLQNDGLSLEEIQTLFTPLNFKWEDKKKKQSAVEDTTE